MRRLCIIHPRASFTMLACAGLVMAASGCWQEIEYVGPGPVAGKPAAASTTDDAQASIADSAAELPAREVGQTSDVAAEASGFGDELTANLASESTAPTDTSASESQPISDDRYGIQEPHPSVLLPHELPAATDSSESPSTSDRLLENNSSQPAPATDLTSPSNEAPSMETAAHTESPQNAADQVDEQVPESVNTRLAAWRLGSKLSLAALANDRAVAPDKVQHWLADSQKVAAALNTELSDLPPTGAAGESGNPSRDVLQYLFNESAQISRRLTTTYGPDHAALYEVAVKSNLLLVLYQPGSSTAGAIAAAIRDAAPRGQLPHELVQPLVELVSAGAEPADVRRRVQRLHTEVEQHLSRGVER